MNRPDEAWHSQENFGDHDAKVRESGDSRLEALWGGAEGNVSGDDHGHLVSNDGINAAYLREPGGEVLVDDSVADGNWFSEPPTGDWGGAEPAGTNGLDVGGDAGGAW